MPVRRCDRPDCSRPASASLSYRYSEQSVWVGDFTADDDAQHVLCGAHAERMRVPQGWQLIDLRVLTPFATGRAGEAVA